MNVFRLLAAEFAKITAKKGLLISVTAALLVPMLYGAILLSPTWGPYDNLSNLPVAVVNNDTGAMSGEEKINVGQDLVEDLKKGKDLGWEFVSNDEASDGLDSLKYYMVIKIPEDFSERVTTVLEEDPKKLELTYIQNEGLNFMAASVTKSATEKIREKLANKITEKYVTNLFSNLTDISKGFESAADGSTKLADGTTSLYDGTNQLLDSLTAKQDDISKLANGAQQLENGTGQLLFSLSSKQKDITALANGAKDLKAGTGLLLSNLEAKSGDIGSLAKGAKDLEKGALTLNGGTAQILDGLQAAQTGSEKLKEGLGALEPGSKQLAAGLGDAQKGATELAAGGQNLAAGLEAYGAKNPYVNDPNFKALVAASKLMAEKLKYLAGASGALKDGAEKIAGGLAAASPGSAALDEGIDKLAAGQETVNNGAAALAAGSSKIAAGTNSVQTGWNAMTKGVTDLNAGAAKISFGNASVNKGWQDLTAGASKLHDGTGQVKEGNFTVEKGWGDLTAGVTKLNNGAGQLDDGSKKLSEGLKEGAEKTGGLNIGDKNIGMFSSPVELVANEINSFPHYRDSTAPYVLSLALFVGVLIMSMFIDFKKPVEMAASSFSWFTVKFLKLSSLAVLQALLLTAVSILILQIEISNTSGFILFAMLVSVAFSAIVMFFATVGGNVGRFFALALVILQLSTTGANLPIPMLPEYLRNLSEYLPFTYSISGFKTVLTIDQASNTMENASVLAGYLAVFAVLSLIAFIAKPKSQNYLTDLSA